MINRSRLLAGLAVVAGVALSGCSAPAAPSAPAAAPSGGAAAPSAGAPAAVTPKVNRVVMITTPPTRNTFEMRHMSETYSWMLRPMYDFLVVVNAQTGKLEPGVASEWGWEPDGKSVRFKLRKDVPFHNNGGNATAADMKFVSEQLALTDSEHGQAPYWRSTVQTVEIVNDYEFIYHLKQTDGNFVTAISEQQGGAEIQSKASFTKSGVANYTTGPLNGTGPYQYLAGAEAQYQRYQRAPFTHWRAKPEFPEFEFRFAKEPSTRQAALIAGEAHIAQLSADLEAQVEKQGMQTIHGSFPGIRVYGNFHCCYFNDPLDPAKGFKWPNSPLMDPRVRQAVNRSINRDELNKALYGGKGDVMYMNHMNPSRPGWNPGWEKAWKDSYSYDPAAAKKLLADAGRTGFKVGISVLATTGVAGGEDLAEAVASYLRAVGIDAQLQNIDPAEQNNKQRALAFDSQISFAATAADIWTGWYIRNSSLATRGGLEDPDIDKLLRTIVITTDEKKRDELWRQVGDTALPRFVAITLFWLPVEASINPKIVAGWVYPGTSPGGYTHVWNIKPAP